ncbi:DUF4268 domain-containing protein [Algoriphagus namhaensis]|uniref:DUF4268 domain-containing protein n=1 Tax=Algoriphagus namhaensis TaxID=915353 RepID=A0ABV8AVU5_9BACT
MYKVNLKENSLIQLEKRFFKDLKIRERQHLQEWISKNPEVLEDELLIIQKEFDGFSNTSERLDLLALDKDGNLVIIENKLDDTGRDVVWQSLKYASYCSTLTIPQILEIFQKYLDKQGNHENAKTKILEFLDVDENNLVLNQNDQRVFLVANSFRKEVTATVLWLREHDIDIQCFRAVPYSLGEDVFLQVEQIIPLPETKDFIINIREKEKEEKEISKKVKETNQYLIEFWQNLKDLLQSNNLHYLDNVSASSRWYLGFGRGKGNFNYCIGSKFFRVELYFPGDSEKIYFNRMLEYKAQIESCFPSEIIWQELKGKKATRIKFEMPKATHDALPGKWGDKEREIEVHKWFLTSMDKFYNCLSPFLDNL